ncbi:MAG: UbiA-like polyprenyltransferase [Ferruginibacter sp.]
MIKNYLSLIKFSHTIFALPFALIGFFIAYQRSGYILFANQQNIYIKFLLVVLCMVFARSAAMAFNRYLDRHIDAANPRTANREIPAGIISHYMALLFTIVSCILFVTCTYFINRLCFYLSPVALFVILFYSYTKRFTALCHLVLGLGLSLAPIGAYLAVTGRFAWLPLIFSAIVLCWVSGFDIIYALQDEGFDKSKDLHSIPALLGKQKALIMSRFLHFGCALLVVVAGVYGHFGIWYWVGAVVFIFLLFFQQSVVKPTDLSRVNLAFMTSNGIASVVFAILVITDLFFSK